MRFQMNDEPDLYWTNRKLFNDTYRNIYIQMNKLRQKQQLLYVDDPIFQAINYIWEYNLSRLKLQTFKNT